VALLSVTGYLDDVGLRALQRDVDGLLDGGARFLATDLAQVTGCDHHLLDLLVALVISSSTAVVGCGWSDWAPR
jgi:hypothetical protein